ncbi:MAG: NAD(P)H-dependent oxidoreductase subunit E, partial [Bacteroidales bacterium]|nr:NAD(P)H-dependent oxidoreductase subunit E [Bacteroidales bacterium]
MKDTIDAILKKHIPKEKGNLIPVLQSVQKKEGYISPESVKRISNYFRISRSSIYGIATFYSQFRFNPPGRHSIKICLGTACHVQGGDFILKALQAEIGISPGETTDDMRFDLDRVACLGCCA